MSLRHNLRLLRAAKINESDNERAEIIELLRSVLSDASATGTFVKKHDVFNIVHILDKLVDKDQSVCTKDFVELLIQFLISDSCFKYMNAELCADISALFSKTLNPSNLNAIQPIYNYFMNKFLAEFQLLRNYLDGEFLSSKARKREFAIIAMLSALDSLVVAKSSIIVLRGLSPSLFSLLFELLPIKEKWLVTYFPNGFLCLLSLAKKFAETNNQFVSNSDLFTASSSVKTSFYVESPLAKNFAQILDTVGVLLDVGLGVVGENGETLLIEWLDALNQCVGGDAAKILADERTSGIDGFRRALLNCLVGQTLSKKSNSSLKVLLTSIHRFFAFLAFSDVVYFKEFLKKLIDMTDTMPTEQFFKLMMQLPSDHFLGNSFRKIFEEMNYILQHRLCKLFMGTFYFQIIFNFLADDVLPSFYDKESSNLLTREIIDRLYAMLHDNNEKQDKFCTRHKWTFVAQQFAFFCVENRLKTPLGKPIDTFTSLEKIITDIRAQIDYRLDEAIENGKLPKKANKLSNITRKVDFVLDMVDAFDKLMNYSTRGSILNVAEISTGLHLFFQTNEQSWQGWMTRITMPTMAVCFASGRFAQIIRLGNNLFHETEQRFHASNKALKMDLTMMSALCWMVRAFVELSSSFAIRGVKNWVQKIFQIEMCWIDYAEQLAAYNFEAAAQGFCDLLRKDRLHDCVRIAVSEMCIKALKISRNYEFVQTYFDVITQLPISTSVNNAVDKSAQKNTKHDAYLKMQTASALALSSWSSLQINSSSTQFGDKICEFDDVSTLLDDTELSLMRYFLLSSDSNNTCFRSRIKFRVEFEENFPSLYKMILTNNRDDCVTHNAKAAILKQIFLIRKAEEKRAYNNNKVDGQQQKLTVLDKSIANNYSAMRKLWNIFEESSQNLEIGTMLSSWLSRLYTAEKASRLQQHNSVNGFSTQSYSSSSTLRPTLINAHAKLAHLAAKTGNHVTSQLHLRKYSEVLTIGGIQNDTSFNFSPVATSNGSLFHSAALALRMHSRSGDSPNSFLPQSPFFSYLNEISSKSADSTAFDTNASLMAFLQTAKITWNSNAKSTEIHVDSYRNMLNVLRAHSDANSTIFLNTSSEIKRKFLLGKMCLCLGKWSNELPNSINVLFQMQTSSPHIFTQKVLHYYDQLQICSPGMNMSELLNGSFLLAAPTSLNIFYALADWALQQMYLDYDEKCFAFANDSSKNDVSEVLRISSNDSALIRRIGFNIDLNDGKRFLSLLGKCGTLERFKQAVKLAFNLDDSSRLLSALSLADFQQTFSLIKRRQYKLYEIALNSSINFLANAGEINDKNELKHISSALRVLKFLASQPDWFKQTTESNWLTKLDSVVWKNVIPQVFARLSHFDKFVRHTALNILISIGNTQPQVVCFPAVVGAFTQRILRAKSTSVAGGDYGLAAVTNSMMSSSLYADEEDGKRNELEDEFILANLCPNRRNSFSKNQLWMQENCRHLVDFLLKKHARLIEDVVEFCCEMNKVNVLREERWLFALTRADNELTRLCAKTEADFRQQAGYEKMSEEEKRNGIRQSHESITLRAYEKFMKLFEETCEKAAETENDVCFCNNFNVHLKEALKHFYENRFNLTSAFEPFRKIMNMITTRAMKRSTLSLHTSDISPYLANLTASNIPIPGQKFNCSSSALVTIQSVENFVYVLPTKTRPKKITFVGSDGKNYTFLFKGHEDLRLDERVMQLSSICNALLRAKASRLIPYQETRNMSEFLSSTYSVTPLSHEAGLIEWVDGSTSLYQLYRKWKIRELENQEYRRQQTELKAKATMTSDSPTHQPVSGKRQTRAGKNGAKTREQPIRPSEQFFNKLKAVFAEESVPSNVLRDRKLWPIGCLEKVYNALVKETPQDILAKELWMHAGNSSTWWRITRCFARSAAATSIVGWTVLGLGDRHLDNVLVDLCTGRIVHVDYNVSFEKGRTLRILEPVPFRLTGNIVSALGPTKTEGIYRESAVQVLTQLRANKEILLLALDAFVKTNNPGVIAECDADLNASELITPAVNNLHNNSNNHDNANNGELFLIDAGVIRAIRRKLSGIEAIDCNEVTSADTVVKDIVVDGNNKRSTTAMTSSEQVDYLVRKATSCTNLALLYEGWTAWV